eukprot:9499076-Pyramimonas_sp.AAC.1
MRLQPETPPPPTGTSPCTPANRRFGARGPHMTESFALRVVPVPLPSRVHATPSDLYFILKRDLWGVVCTLAVTGTGGPVQNEVIVSSRATLQNPPTVVDHTAPKHGCNPKSPTLLRQPYFFNPNSPTQIRQP